MRKEENEMKKYNAPEMMSLDFIECAQLEGSNTFNDGELEW